MGTSVAFTPAVNASLRDIRLRPSVAVRASLSDDGLVLLDMNGGLVLASNAVGARIWQLIEQMHTPDEIARQLAAEYEIPHDRAHNDVTAFISSLVTRNLVTEDSQS